MSILRNIISFARGKQPKQFKVAREVRYEALPDLEPEIERMSEHAPYLRVFLGADEVAARVVEGDVDTKIHLNMQKYDLAPILLLEAVVVADGARYTILVTEPFRVLVDVFGEMKDDYDEWYSMGEAIKCFLRKKFLLHMLQGNLSAYTLAVLPENVLVAVDYDRAVVDPKAKYYALMDFIPLIGSMVLTRAFVVADSLLDFYQGMFNMEIDYSRISHDDQFWFYRGHNRRVLNSYVKDKKFAFPEENIRKEFPDIVFPGIKK